MTEQHTKQDVRAIDFVASGSIKLFCRTVMQTCTWICNLDNENIILKGGSKKKKKEKLSNQGTEGVQIQVPNEGLPSNIVSEHFLNTTPFQ